MLAEHLQRLESLFAVAVELTSEARRAFLDAECGANSALRSEIESLLAADERVGGLFEKPALEALGDAQPEVQGEWQLDPGPEQRIGSYRTIRRIGAGGMGAVYLAARSDDQFRQLVAVKVIRRGMDHEAIIRRFRHERQILAGLNHPNIARLLDGGATEDGLPWFALEYIEGRPLTEYCDRRQLPIRERLRLFLTVCAAVQHAHQNLVVHRDLKPGNILITPDGTPKLLDFGIAKVLHADSSEETLDLTLTGMKPMTPAYASPEQARGASITTASDVYSLGVILYELLTHRRPYHVSSRMTENEITRIICEQEPVKPSLIVTKREEEDRPMPPEIEPVKLARQLRGDLDNIVLKALGKEPSQRYSTVEQFAEDLHRHLAGQPVRARSATLAYRTAKFMRRNKALVTMSSLVVLSLLIGIIIAVWQARAAQQQATLVLREKEKAERIGAFLQTMLAYANPNWDSPGYGRGPDVKLVDAIKDAEKRIDTELKAQPEVRAELRHVIGKAWLFRGEYAAAEQNLRAALALRRQLYGEWHPQIARTLGFLANTAAELGKSEEAESLNRQTVTMMRALEPENELLSWQILDLGGRLLANGKREEGEQALLESLDLFRRRFGDQHRGVALAYKRLADSYTGRGNLDQALAVYQQLIAQSRLSGTHQDTADVWYNQGKIEYYKGDYQAAEQSFSESLKIFQQVQGNDSPLTVRVLYCLAKTHLRQQRYEPAIREAQRAVEIGQLKRPAGHPQLITALVVLSHVLVSAGQTQRATPILREAASQYWSRPDRKTVGFQDAAVMLGECFTLLNRYAEAEALLLECHASLIATRSEQSPRMAETRLRLVQLYEAWGKPEAASPYL